MERVLGDGDVRLVRSVVVDAGDDGVLADVLLADLALIAVPAPADRSLDDPVAHVELRDRVAHLDVLLEGGEEDSDDGFRTLYAPPTGRTE